MCGQYLEIRLNMTMSVGGFTMVRSYEGVRCDHHQQHSGVVIFRRFPAAPTSVFLPTVLSTRRVGVFRKRAPTTTLWEGMDIALQADIFMPSTRVHAGSTTKHQQKSVSSHGPS